MGARKERERHAARVSLAPVLSCAHYFVVQAIYAQTYFEIEEKIAEAAPAVLPFRKMAVAHGEATFFAV